jgi:hypothetical protein
VNPCKHPIVILKDVGHKELVAILQFMYRGEVNVRQEELTTFLKTAEMLQIKGLTGNDSPTTVGILLLCVSREGINRNVTHVCVHFQTHYTFVLISFLLCYNFEDSIYCICSAM